jgi:hypothetical protein
MYQQLASVTATVLAAPADGVAPALLLSISDSSSKGRTLGQYLINAPEGVSRLMLEHRCRPGLHFKALFLSGCSAAEVGGLGGLLLRLKQDGHGAMQLVGPAGVLCYMLLITLVSCRQASAQHAVGVVLRLTSEAADICTADCCAAALLRCP